MARTASPSSTAPFDGDYSFINVVPDGNSWTDWSKAPKTRKRITKDQLETLEAHFRITSHPSREERQMLALKTGMELRSVTIWLQNKRQIVKKSAKAAAEGGTRSESSSSPLSSTPGLPNAPPRTTLSPAPADTASRGSAGPRPSLDRVASLSEIQSPVRPVKLGSSQDPQALWTHMPSSPPSSPPSGSQPSKRTRNPNPNPALHKVTGRPYPALSRTASVDSAITAVSSSSPRETRSRLSKPGFTLEWACAQAAARPPQDDEGVSTEEDDCTLSQASQSTASVQDADVPASSEEMEAALALCGLLRG